MTFGEKMRALMAERHTSLRKLAAITFYDVGHLSRVSRDLKPPSPKLARLLDDALHADGELAALADSAPARRAVKESLTPEDEERVRLVAAHPSRLDDAFGVDGEPVAFTDPAAPLVPQVAGDELEALELARRVAASDVGEDVLTSLEMTVDDLASAYPGTPPGELLGRVRLQASYVGALLDGRMTLAQRRRLIVVGGWLSLLAATCAIDLHRRPAALARLRTAAALAEHARHPEISAWCLETEAWQAVTDGDYRRAVELARGAQRIAPKTGSAFIQATAQEGRAWARLGDGAAAREALGRVERLVAPLPQPDRPEHHYRYDPAKSDAYTATTLAWAGDAAAEPYARGVLARLESGRCGPPRPRRAASARLDLALAQIAAGQPDGAAGTAQEAVTSGRLVPSNYWRAAEVLAAVKARNVPEAAELYEAYREFCAPDASEETLG